MKKAIGALAILLAAVVIAVFLDRNVFVVRDVAVVSAHAVDKTSVIRASGVDMGGRMRTLDLARIARGVESTGEHACLSVKKVYPSTVRIEIRQREAAAIAEAGGFVLLLDEAGYVMSISKQVPDVRAIYVTGLEIGSYELGRRISADEQRIYAMTQVIDAMSECAASDLVSELNVGDLKDLYIYSRTGIYVSLGDAEHMTSKALWMKHSLMDLESRGETSGRLDVSSGEKADYKAN